MPTHYRKRRRRGGKSAKSMAYKALKAARRATAAIETKFIDSTDTNIQVSWDGTPNQFLNNPIQGISDTERIGDSILTKSVKWSVTFQNGGSNASAIRMIMIWDKRSTTTQLDSILQVTGAAAALNSNYIKDSRDDYIVLYDRVINCDQVHYRNHTVVGFKKINKKTQFQLGTTFFEKGALKLYFVSDIDPMAAAVPFITGFFRVYYQDA